jgi:hypothetical protein
MNDDVDKLYGELHSELSKQHDEMKDYLDKVQASVSLPKNLLKRGSIEEIISSQKLIDEKIEKLSNQQPENLAAVNDGSIQYIPDDIGNINVDEIVAKLGHVEGKVCAIYGILPSVHYGGLDSTSARSTKQMCLIYSINQPDTY